MPSSSGFVAQRTRRWTSVIVTSGFAHFEGSSALAAATLPMAGISVDSTNCSYASSESHTSTP
jgi:hypothetical protein